MHSLSNGEPVWSQSNRPALTAIGLPQPKRAALRHRQSWPSAAPFVFEWSRRDGLGRHLLELGCDCRISRPSYCEGRRSIARWRGDHAVDPSAGQLRWVAYPEGALRDENSFGGLQALLPSGRETGIRLPSMSLPRIRCECTRSLEAADDVSNELRPIVRLMVLAKTTKPVVVDGGPRGRHRGIH